jgi:intracellular septation protein
MLLEWLIQFGPVGGFFLVFELTNENFFVATAVLMILVIVAAAASLVRSKRIPWFPLWGAAFVLLFGGATLVLNDPQWLIVKDTFYDGVFGLTILVGLALRRNLLRKFFNPLFAIHDRGWHVLSVRWALFFLFSAALNEIIRHAVPPNVWVWYKLLNTVAFILFGLYQFRLTGQYRLVGEANHLGMRIRREEIPKP